MHFYINNLPKYYMVYYSFLLLKVSLFLLCSIDIWIGSCFWAVSIGLDSCRKAGNSKKQPQRFSSFLKVANKQWRDHYQWRMENIFVL